MGNNSDGKNGTEMMKRVRNAVRDVVPCDVFQKNVLTNGGEQRTFDVVISVYCFECAVTSLDSYAEAVGNVVKLLKPNGCIILVVRTIRL